MGGPVLVVLLLCLSGTWAQAGSGGADQGLETGSNLSGDIWAEVRALRDMVVELKVELRYTKAELQTQKDKVAVLEKENTEISRRLRATENKVNASENKVTALRVDLEATQTQMELQKTKVEELINENVKYAFTAGSSVPGLTGPYDTEKQLIFGRVLSNIGGAYNPYTGIFTAPVKGVYYLRFTAYTNQREGWAGVNLYHNNKIVLHNSENSGPSSLLANALILQMEEGSVAYMTMYRTATLFEDNNFRNTFSGFLLYRL